jgi:hypothetical protein
MRGQSWSATADWFLGATSKPACPHIAWFRQVVTHWEMAAAMVLHGAISGELCVDCNAEGSFLLAKIGPILINQQPKVRNHDATQVPRFKF